MSHLTTDASAIALGAGIGLGAGLWAPRAVRIAFANGPDRGRPGKQLPRAAVALIVALAAASGALIGARFGLGACLPAYLYLAAIAPLLGTVDAATRTLPNRIVLPAYPLAVMLLGFAAWRIGDAGALWRALAGGMLLYATFLAVALVAPPGSLGFGDVKLAGLLGGFLGFVGWMAVWLGMMIAFGLAALYVVVRLLVRHGQRDQMVPLGPALLVGSLVAVIVS